MTIMQNDIQHNEIHKNDIHNNDIWWVDDIEWHFAA